MKLRPILIAGIIACFTLSLFAFNTDAYSDPIGVFARVDKVIFEPNDAAPERIQIWGAFALASKQGGGYEPVQRGYLYFSINPGKEETCRKEWNDLKSVAGTDQIVAFARRYQPIHLRKPADKPADPDLYSASTGVTKVRSQDATDFPPIRDLRALPREH